MVILEGLAFGEGPRWREGALYWSDMHAWTVNRLRDGEVETLCEVPTCPSGLGWLPDGRLLVVSMTDKRVLRREHDGSLVLHADLGALAPRRCNDMVVDRQGRAYVGNFGFETNGVETPRPTVLVRVDPDGTASVVADELWFPNGAIITPDQRQLVVAETYGNRLTAFSRSDDGALSDRRTWAALPKNVYPDGIAQDVEGAIWVASPTTSECLRVREGGEILQSIPTGQPAYACALGGEAARTLFVLTADSDVPERQRRERNGRLQAFPVDVAGVPQT